ncbi:ABC transporter substrate-binding protein [Nonomuraea jiangxiensis]|uniref:Multiple sugar transport system substrate-binding protein n=1 Tax=Nonomuraea jiangxiensis TaxID=633440 RepID=A0A1G8QAP7_9ACTN|nr:extracellular solute-binding protein [Nonomuraea jiangxiensis]SDJ01874.1 multiple sugar transport system substrate-binding protein [Nonomuraea jiangxiensis]
MRRSLVFGLVTLLSVTGCGVGAQQAGTQASGGKVELTFLVFETPNLDAAFWDAAIARASAKVPGVTIKKLVTPNVDRTGYAKQLDASGDLPDILQSVNPAGFAQAGKFAAFTDQELSGFIAPKAGAIDGKVYQLPYNTQVIPVVYYNKDAFEKAGITETPKTYQELLDVCAKLKAKDVTPFVLGGGGADTWADMYPLTGTVATDVYSRTPDWLSQRAAGKVKFTDPDFTKAVQKVADLAAKGYIDPAGLSRSYADTEQAFRDGKGAMYPMGSWFATSADNDKPGFEVGAFPWPSDDGSPVTPTFTGGGTSVSATAENVELAKKWALAFDEDKANNDAFVKADGSIPAIKGYTPPADMGPVYKATVDIYQQGMKDNSIVNAFSQETGDGSLPPGLADKAALAVQDLITGKKTAAQFGAYLDDQWAKATQ